MVVVLSVPLGTFPHNFSSIKGEDGKTIRTPINGEGIRRKALVSLIVWLRSPSKQFDGTFNYNDKRVKFNDVAVVQVKDGPYWRVFAESSTLDDAFHNGLVDVDGNDVLVLTHKGRTWDYTFKD